MRTLCETSLLQLLIYKSNSAYAHDTNRPGIPTSDMCPRHAHICTLQARWMTIVSLTVSWNTWRGVLRTPFIILLLLTPRFFNLNPPHNALAQTHNTSPIPHDHRASLLAAIPTCNRWPLLPTWQTWIPPASISRLVSTYTMIYARSYT